MAAAPSSGCRFLLGGLILLLILFPVFEDLARPVLLTALVAAVFVVGVTAVHPGRSRVRNAVALAVLLIGVTGLLLTLPADSVIYTCTLSAVLVTTAVLIGYCIYCVLRYVLHATYITRDQIYAGICVYIMFGFAFGCIYYIAGMLDPGGFAVNTGKSEPSRRPDLMYFSFVTLATLGYGDITPVTKAVRIVAELEALSGSLYMAGFMARLVSMANGPAPAVQGGIPDRNSDSQTWIGSGGGRS